MILKSKS